jgi:hypothetical protein
MVVGKPVYIVLVGFTFALHLLIGLDGLAISPT